MWSWFDCAVFRFDALLWLLLLRSFRSYHWFWSILCWFLRKISIFVNTREIRLCWQVNPLCDRRQTGLPKFEVSVYRLFFVVSIVLPAAGGRQKQFAQTIFLLLDLGCVRTRQPFRYYSVLYASTYGNWIAGKMTDYCYSQQRNSENYLRTVVIIFNYCDKSHVHGARDNTKIKIKFKKIALHWPKETSLETSFLSSKIDCLDWSVGCRGQYPGLFSKEW